MHVYLLSTKRPGDDFYERKRCVPISNIFGDECARVTYTSADGVGVAGRPTVFGSTTARAGRR